MTAIPKTTLGNATPVAPGAVPYQAAPTTAFDQALIGDGYGWLAALLPPPTALTCPRCRRPMCLPAVPLLWHCPSCDTPPDGRTA